MCVYLGFISLSVSLSIYFSLKFHADIQRIMTVSLPFFCQYSPLQVVLHNEFLSRTPLRISGVFYLKSMTQDSSMYLHTLII